VKQPSVALADRAETAEEVSELFGEIAVVLGPGHRGFVVVRELVVPGPADAENRRKAVADTDAILGAYLIGGDQRRVGLQRKDNQVEHGADIVSRSARGDVEVDRSTIDRRQSAAEPVLSAGEAAFDLAKRFQELVQPLLVGPA